MDLESLILCSSENMVQHDSDDSLPAVDRDRSILSKLLLGFMHLANEINESLPGFRHALLRPISKLELPYCPGLAILQTQSAWSEDRR